MPPGDTWLHEIKYDGWRLTARTDHSPVALYTRGGVEWSKRIPAIARALTTLRVGVSWLDGELVYLRGDGRPDFAALHDSINGGDQRGLYYHIWDVPWLDGNDLTRAPLVERKERLRELLRNSHPRLRYTDHIVGSGAEVFSAVEAQDLEGIVSKRCASRYRPGERSRDWRKIKVWRRETVTLGGLEWDAEGRLAALLVGTPHGRELRYDGRVEFGLGRLNLLGEGLVKLVADRAPFAGEWKGSHRQWLRPEVQVEIQALPRRDGETLRHATLIGPQ